MELCNFKNLIKSPTCFQNPENRSWVDLFLTNRLGCFQGKSVFDTDISDFHKLAVTALRGHFKKQEHKTIRKRNYKKFNNEEFRPIMLNKRIYGNS